MAGDMHHFYRNTVYNHFWPQDGVPDKAEFIGSLSKSEIARHVAEAARWAVSKSAPQTEGAQERRSGARKQRKLKRTRKPVIKRKARKSRRRKGQKRSREL
eukprot:2143850-Amphidinium_carterae.1